MKRIGAGDGSDEVGHRVRIRRPATDRPIGGDADDLFFDGERQQVYAICGEGAITVVQQNDADQYVAISQVSTAPGARTGLFVATQRTLYVAVPARQSTPAEIRAYKVK